MASGTVSSTVFRMPEDGIPSLDGEDVAVFVGVCPNEDLPFFEKQIVDKAVSTIVVLFDPTDELGGGKAAKLVQALQEFPLPRLPVERRFYICDLAHWNRCRKGLRRDGFALSLFHADKRLPVPEDLRPATVPEDDSFFREYDDIPRVRDDLRRVVRAFASSAVDGLWPAALLTGETGVGKSFTARAIRDAFRKTCGGGTCPFVHLNCGEFGKEDMNAALFGLRGGSFTNTTREDRPGAIECAKDGVLFLDEIGTLPLELQPRLLMALDGHYRLHGGVDSKAVQCRFVFGTNDDLRKAVAEGRFRRDLYSRINGLSVCLPSVRERIGGQGGTVFLDRTLESLGRRFNIRFSRLAHVLFREFAARHPWRGNFRELRRAFLLLRTMASDASGFVSAPAIQVLERQLRDAEADSGGGGTAFFHPLVADRRDLGANEKVLLSWAFACAARVGTATDAGKLFFAGGKEKANWNSSFASCIGKYGYKWDANADGHIVRRTEEGEAI